MLLFVFARECMQSGPNQLRWDLLRDVLIAGDVTKVKVREEQVHINNRYKDNQYTWAMP